MQAWRLYFRVSGHCGDCYARRGTFAGVHCIFFYSVATCGSVLQCADDRRKSSTAGVVCCVAVWLVCCSVDVANEEALLLVCGSVLCYVIVCCTVLQCAAA